MAGPKQAEQQHAINYAMIHSMREQEKHVGHADTGSHIASGDVGIGGGFNAGNRLTLIENSGLASYHSNINDLLKLGSTMDESLTAGFEGNMAQAILAHSPVVQDTGFMGNTSLTSATGAKEAFNIGQGFGGEKLGLKLTEGKGHSG